jgi:hypothetical protein
MAFSTFMACELQKAKIPYALNADFQFYDGEEGLAARARAVVAGDDCARL